VTHPGGWKGAYEAQQRRAEAAEAKVRELQAKLDRLRPVDPNDSAGVVESVIAAGRAKP
jgi:hypothetical protein